MRFTDQAVIVVQAGAGGNGCIAFRREKYIPLGGPAGGDGGCGGDVWLVTQPGSNTLLDYRYRRNFAAQSGGHGMGKGRNGKNGVDLFLPLPIGTEVYDAETGYLLFDLSQPGQRVRICSGGKGGRGNIHFKSSVRQAPRCRELGGVGEQFTLRLELKILADIGIIGLPNVGKSSLLGCLTRAKSRVGDYPFTTRYPMLGLLADPKSFKELVIADLPGLIAGAADGRGLGTRFLGHVERTRVLLHVLSAQSCDLPHDYQTVRSELLRHNEMLADLPEVVVVNKIDLLTGTELAALKATIVKQITSQTGRILFTSTFSSAGLQQLAGELLAHPAVRQNTMVSDKQQATEPWTPLN